MGFSLGIWPGGNKGGYRAPFPMPANKCRRLQEPGRMWTESGGWGEALGMGGRCRNRERACHWEGAFAAEPSLRCLGDVGPVLPKLLTFKRSYKSALNLLNILKSYLCILFWNSFRFREKLPGVQRVPMHPSSSFPHC